MEAILFALISFLGWGIGDLMTTVSARKLNAYSATFWSLVISVLLLSLYIPFALQNLKQLTIELFLLNIFLGFILLVGIITYREGLIIGSSPLVVTIAASFTAVATILSIIFFKEQLTIYQALSIAIIFIGILLSMLDFRKLIKKNMQLDKGLMLALISMVLWGIYFTFIKIPVQKIGWFWPNYFSFLFFVPFIFLFLRWKKIKLYMPNHNKTLFPLLGAIIFSRGAELSFNLGIERGYTSVIAPIAGASPILFIILAVLFLKDSITRQQILGIVTTLVGIILLSILSI